MLIQLKTYKSASRIWSTALSLALMAACSREQTVPPRQTGVPKVESTLVASLRLRVTEEPLGGSPVNCDYSVEATLNATPLAVGENTLFSVRLNSFSVRDASERLVIGFKHLDEGVQYSSDPEWTAEERERIYQGFQVDLGQEDPNDDNSLLRETMKLALRPQGKFAELTLTPRVLQALQLVAAGHPGKLFLREFLSHPDALPALLGSDVSGAVWQTEGHFLKPIRWVHQAGPDVNGKRTVTTRSVADTSAATVDGRNIQTDVTMTWELEGSTVVSLKGEAYLLISQSLMGSDGRSACWLNWSIGNSTVAPLPGRR